MKAALIAAAAGALLAAAAVVIAISYLAPTFSHLGQGGL